MPEKYQKAYIFTKFCKLTPTWQHVSNLIGMSFTETKVSNAFGVLAPAPKKPMPEHATTNAAVSCDGFFCVHAKNQEKEHTIDFRTSC